MHRGSKRGTEEVTDTVIPKSRSANAHAWRGTCEEFERPNLHKPVLKIYETRLRRDEGRRKGKDGQQDGVLRGGEGESMASGSSPDV